MQTDVFTFTSLRAPNSPQEENFHARYIKDDYPTLVKDEANNCYNIKRPERLITKPAQAVLSGVDSTTSTVDNNLTNSATGSIIYDQLFCTAANLSLDETAVNKNIIKAILDQQQGVAGPYIFKIPALTCDNAAAILLNDYTNECFQYDEEFYKIPATLLNVAENKKYQLLLKADKIITRFLLGNTAKENPVNKHPLLRDLEDLLANSFGAKPLANMVFNKTAPAAGTNNVYTPEFANSKAALFEVMYQYYIIRRVTTVNLEQIITALRVLHLMEWLVVDAYLQDSASIGNNTGIKLILDSIVSDMHFVSFFLVTVADIQLYYDALPVIHPLYARLAWYKKPFNEIKPIGIGDLKVVKQTLLGYAPGEISYIHNVMKGETYEKSHRRLDKTEDTFTFSSEQTNDTEKEAQTTDKFEVKKEADNVIKNDLQINANASLSYNGPVVANITGGMSYHTSSEDSQKLSSNFARDVMSKAVSKVQAKASATQSSTKISEIEEINKHGIINTDKDATHQSGIYRWVDKKYKSQVYNYGKRLMFEFLIPEPAAFYIQSKLKGFEMFDLQIPTPPIEPEKAMIDYPFLPFSAESITKENFVKFIFNKYDLAGISPQSYPEPYILGISLENDLVTHTNVKGQTDLKRTSTESHLFKLKYNDYTISKVAILSGSTVLYDLGGNFDPNHGILKLNGETIPTDKHLGGAINQQNHSIGAYNLPNTLEYDLTIDASDGNVRVDFDLQNWKNYDLKIVVDLTLKDTALPSWQKMVFDKIKSYVEAPSKKKYDEDKAKYDAAFADYNAKIEALKAQTVNDLIQGKSEAYNKDIILKELKKHCITMLTKEFDLDERDDLFSNLDAMSDILLPPSDPLKKNLVFQKFKVDTTKVPAKASFDDPTNKLDVKYPSIDIKQSKVKGRYVQFLEQAFEWQHLGYLFYPYFWAAQKKWITLMNHLDYTDKNMTDFLQAGSVRVLLAVQPSYCHAVLHFLATREPWCGGNVPVIGDPLYLPLFEEIHKQQDNLAGATAEGDAWEFTVPTSLIYLQDSASKLPGDAEFALKT